VSLRDRTTSQSFNDKTYWIKRTHLNTGQENGLVEPFRIVWNKKQMLRAKAETDPQIKPRFDTAVWEVREWFVEVLLRKLTKPQMSSDE
jgi:hypothetical protein